MGTFDHSAAALRIFGDDLDPENLTRLLRCEPSVAQRTGDVIRYSSGRERTVKRGNWRLVANRAEPEDLDGQLRWILSQITNDLSVWKAIVETYDVDMFCGMFMGESNDGFSLSPEVLLMLGERGIKLDFDVYDSGNEEIQESNAPLDADAARRST